jgi:hypothetical protein
MNQRWNARWMAMFILIMTTGRAVAGQYKNFIVSVYIPVGVTRSLSDPQRLQEDWDRLSSQVKIDKVYIENYRENQWADEETIEPIKKFYTDHGVNVAGGVTMAAGNIGGQFQTFSYADPKDRETAKKAIEMAARHFDEVILDDFFFYCTKTDADIAAKGDQSWTQYRLDTMREAAKDLVVGPAKAVNPKVKVIVKYPNWYEHFQGLGFDLDQEPKIFDGIYTGTETRDPGLTDQHLQAYESYEIIRYFENIAPGKNGGGWVDTFSTRSVDRYAEQLWDTAFAKPREITLFNWAAVARQAVAIGDRSAWEKSKTSFDAGAMAQATANPTWGAAAGISLRQVDGFLDKLGKPIGIANYKPYQSTGEDFLQHYLGMIGIPIEMQPTFPADSDLVLLTESAKFDPEIVAKIKGQLKAGKNVVITSGLLAALKGKGIDDIVELEPTGRTVAVRNYLGGYGPGNGIQLAGAESKNPMVMIPEIRFMTNDAWQLVSAVEADTGFPILLMDRYSKGILYVLTIPENQGDLYNYPQGVLTAIKRVLLRDFPVWTDSPAKVSVFAYDNHTFIVQSFSDEEASVNIMLPPGVSKVRNIVSGEEISPASTTQESENPRARGQQPRHTRFPVQIMPHSYEVLSYEQ